jgi:vitamin B12 transporter
MRCSRFFAAAFFLLGIGLVSFAFAEIKIKVVDPQETSVAGAQVQLLDQPRLMVQETSAEGIAIFREASSKSGSYRVEVLAPGFAAETADTSSREDVITIKLHVATAAESVIVTATRTLLESNSAGADVDILSSGQLEAMQPIAAADAVRFLSGAVVNTAGQRGGLSSLFVRGGDSTYNKVIVDGVVINEPGGTFDFGTLPFAQVDRVEFVRGAQSTLYGTDAMTSVVQTWSRSGSTRLPELRFGADGGNFGTANGYASLAGAHAGFDYNFFGDNFYTNGQGINDFYSDSMQGANVGAAIADNVALRVRVRHSNSRTGVPGEWDFNGSPLQPPDPNEWSHYNNLLGSVELAVAAPNGWQHHFTGFDYLYRYNELNVTGDPNRIDDFPSHNVDRINRAGFEYQGDYSERTWAHTTFGYRVENENGYVGDVNYGQTHGQRLNNDLYVNQQLTLGRLTAIAGGRFVHDSAYGNTGVPRVALTLLARRGGETFSGTRLRFTYSTGFKEPRLEETYNGIPPDPYDIPNTGLKPERVRSFEAGMQQDLFNGRAVLTATYFNSLFHDQINYIYVDPVNFVGEYMNVNKAFAQGAEIGLQSKLRTRLFLNTAYTYTSTQILDNPAPIDPQYNPGMPLLRRPKHSAITTLSYLGSRWGGNLGGSFVGRRPDDDFLGLNIHHAAGYARVDVGGWYAINSRVTAYANVENALNAHYNEVVGYPALTANVHAGIRFRIGGE